MPLLPRGRVLPVVVLMAFGELLLDSFLPPPAHAIILRLCHFLLHE
jgi:hypothetical protein